ncbi:MAG: hypothetical protein PHW14_00645 [Candidatus Omnitrophica bacterium]|nr:hypothetical protein [Candidatus Omnitrophota bacterium]
MREKYTHCRYYPLERISFFALGLAASVVLPFATHLLGPGGDIPLGARLLPMFYAPYLLAVRIGYLEAVAVGSFAPYLNMLLTSRPDPSNVLSLSIEIAVFAVFSRYLSRWSGGSIYSGAMAAILSFFIVTIVLGERLLCVLSPGRTGAFLETLMIALPGLIMLVLLDCLLKAGRDES